MISMTKMPATGECIDGRYLVEGKLGAGGFGVVFRAKDQRTGADVAVKVLDPTRSENEKSAARFRREIDLVARLQHPNTIRVTDCGETQTGCLYLVMELLRGEPLDEVLKREGRLGPARVTTILDQVLRSLAEAHAQGIVHRDLKPENVFLATIAGESDFVKVLDFGIAKGTEDDDVALTASNEIPCSPRYVAPERITQNETTPAGDVYSLGVMTLELLTGRPPFDVDNSMGLLLLHADPTNPVPVPDELHGTLLGDVLTRAVDKDPTRRFTDAGAMLAALSGARAGGLAADTRDAAPSLPTLDSPAQHRRTERELSAAVSETVRASGPAVDGGIAAVAARSAQETGGHPAKTGTADYGGGAASRAPLVAAVVVGVLLVLGAGVGLRAMLTDAPEPALETASDSAAVPAPSAPRVAAPALAPVAAPAEATAEVPAEVPAEAPAEAPAEVPLEGSADPATATMVERSGATPEADEATALVDAPAAQVRPEREAAAPSNRRSDRANAEPEREARRSPPDEERPDRSADEPSQAPERAAEPVPADSVVAETEPAAPPAIEPVPEPAPEPVRNETDWGLGLEPR